MASATLSRQPLEKPAEIGSDRNVTTRTPWPSGNLPCLGSWLLCGCMPLAEFAFVESSVQLADFDSVTGWDALE